MCGFCAKSNTAVNCLVSDNSKKSIPFYHNSTFNTLCRIGFYTVKVFIRFYIKTEIHFENPNVPYRETSSSKFSTHNLLLSICKSATFFIY